MKSTQARLDRFIRKITHKTPKEIRQLLLAKRIRIDGEIATTMNQQITQFSVVCVDQDMIQNNLPVYIMLHKPKGVVSATKDDKHTTVIDLIDHERKHELHIAGRLDFNSSGLLLLTNDGNWSRRLSTPKTQVHKRYHVQLAKHITPEYVTKFEEGIYFAYEDITTRPAHLIITSDFTAQISLTEGRYHQIKRMFGYFQNEVLALHRFAIGNLPLDNNLMPGESRVLTVEEAHAIFDNNTSKTLKK